MKRNVVAWSALVVSLAALFASRSASKPVHALPEIPAEGQKYAKGLSDTFGAVAEFVRPSVVKITVRKHAGNAGAMRFRQGPGQGAIPKGMDPKDFEDFLKKHFGQGFKFEDQQLGGGAQGTGSGFVYDDRGHILTNNHVVSDADSIVVTFHDGEKAEAKVVGTDPRADVAVIKVETTAYPPLPKGQSGKLHVGEWVIAVGSPFELDQTVTAGIISATDRGSVGINEFESFLQTDAAINPGNSGGPLVDLNGRVMGVNSAIATSSRSNSGVGFAIPIDMASALADKLIKDGKVNRVRVGLKLSMESLTPSRAKKLGLDAQTHGVIVDEVVEGSPGAKAGIRAGDVITEFDGRAVSSVPQFRALVSAGDEGKPYDVKYFRDGKKAVASIAPAAEKQVLFAHEKEAESRKATASVVPVEGFGLGVVPASEEILFLLGYPQGARGLVVAEVAKDGPADRARLEKGDLIVQVVPAKGDKPEAVNGVKDFLAAAKGKDELNVLVRNVQKPEAAPEAITLSKKAAPDREAPKDGGQDW